MHGTLTWHIRDKEKFTLGCSADLFGVSEDGLGHSENGKILDQFSLAAMRGDAAEKAVLLVLGRMEEGR